MSIKLRRVIQAIFKAASGCVALRTPDGSIKMSELFNILRGVLQGDIFSALAFIVGLWLIFKSHDLEDSGVTVGKPPYKVRITRLEYADDAGLVDENANNASERVTAISIGSKQDAAMVISTTKMKAMHIHKKVSVSSTKEAEIAALKLKHKCSECGRDFPTARGLSIHKARWCDGGKTIRSRKGSLADKAVQLEKRRKMEKECDHIVMEDEEIENVYYFEYLGSRISCDGDDKADVKYRMNIAQSTFSSLSHIWKDHRLLLSVKLKLYATSVCSTFTHACEAWNLTDSVKTMINGFNSLCLHVITKKEYRENATNPDINLLLLIRRRRMRFVGHVLRMDEHRLVRRTLAAYVHGGEILPDGSLLEDCERLTFEELARIASDRKEWNRRINLLQ